MKHIYIVYALAVLGMGGCATVPTVPDAPKVIEETVKSRIDSFKCDIKVEISKHDGASIENVYLEHHRKKKKTGEKDYLFINGSVKNTSISIMSGIVVMAEFIDEKGNVITSAYDDIIPRIVRRHGARKGHFTIKTEYNPVITKCRLKILRPGEED